MLVCGGKKDFLYCLKHRIKFKWIGFLIKAFDIYYYYGRDKSYVEALNLLNKLFSDDKEKQFIFLWDDMQKLGTSFAHVFRQRDSIEVVCIQHGIYVFNDSNISPGSNSNYNFVFKSSQIDLIKGANENNSFVMGLSYNVSAPAMFKKNIYTFIIFYHLYYYLLYAR